VKPFPTPSVLLTASVLTPNVPGCECRSSHAGGSGKPDPQAV